ncbi:hypothetical protein ABZY16_08650 [Streptomyces sp. NPDC006553]|uniref:hypothetical protein n=1 Tax=unclassified Streptomyces TaxID=2593676 RepID=UPI002259FF78|nr:hypothetical protein [Streptomyces sp. NBC_00233]MCX5226670.1 hypothetical protein [Streptomyces sp. NBC_00233]
MYGQVPTPAATPAPSPPRATGPTAATITVRVLITVLVVLSLGFLAWVAMLRIAIMRRTGRDWAFFWAQLVLNIGCVVPLEQRFADTWMNTAGMVVLLVQMAIVTCYFLVVDIRHHQPAPVVIMVPSPSPHLQQAQPQAYPYGTPQPGYAPPGYATPGYGYPPAADTAPSPVPGQAPVPGPIQGSVPGLYVPTPPPGRVPPPVPGRAPRIEQVRAELDELSDLLRQTGEDDGRA